MISLITTVLNEIENLPTWLASIKEQTILPDEIVIVDGGSKDGTWEWLLSQTKNDPNLKIFQHVGNISQGRNFAIQQAKNNILVVADAGCKYNKGWIRLVSNSITNNQSIFCTTAFGPWLEEKDSYLLYLIATATIPAKKEFKKDWLASSRSVAFTKGLWQNVGGYPEWLPICEDIVFDLKIAKTGVKPTFVRDSLVLWRPRTSLPSYFKQLFKYTKSDGHAKLWFGRQLIRYFTYVLLIALFYLAYNYNINFIWLLIVGGLIYMNKFWQRWFEFTGDKTILFKLSGFFSLPFIIAFGDLAKMCGWPVGVYERLAGKIKFEEYL